jgi:ribosome biogenesis protein BRX1
MAAVYKSLSKSASKADKDTNGSNGAVERKNKQRVLILSSRGVTYRYGRTTSIAVWQAPMADCDG